MERDGALVDVVLALDGSRSCTAHEYEAINHLRQERYILLEIYEL